MTSKIFSNLSLVVRLLPTQVNLKIKLNYYLQADLKNREAKDRAFSSALLYI